MASTSSSVSRLEVPASVRTPPVPPPGKTVMTLVPRLAMLVCTMVLAPCPTDNMAITAPTPMMMPSMVRNERNLLRARERRAMTSRAERRMSGDLFRRPQAGELRGCPQGRGVALVADHLAVPEDDEP